MKVGPPENHQTVRVPKAVTYQVTWSGLVSTILLGSTESTGLANYSTLAILSLHGLRKAPTIYNLLLNIYQKYCENITSKCRCALM